MKKKKREKKLFLEDVIVLGGKNEKKWNVRQLYKNPLRALHLRPIIQKSQIWQPRKTKWSCLRKFWSFGLFLLLRLYFCFNELYIPYKSIPTILKHSVYDLHICTYIIQGGSWNSSLPSVLHVSLWYSLWLWYVYCVELNKTPTRYNKMQILLLQIFSTCFGRHAPIIRSIKYWHGLALVL